MVRMCLCVFLFYKDLKPFAPSWYNYLSKNTMSLEGFSFDYKLACVQRETILSNNKNKVFVVPCESLSFLNILEREKISNRKLVIEECE